MRKRLGFIAMWVLATFASGIVAWGAVSLVGAQVGEDGPDPISSSELAILEEAVAATTSVAPAPTTVTTATTVVSPSTSTPVTETTTSTTAPTTGSTSAGVTSTTSTATTAVTSTSTTAPTTGSTSTSVTTTTIASTSTTEGESTSTTIEDDHDGSDLGTRVVNTAGGTVVAAGTSDGAVLVSASPAEGFAVSVEMAGPPEVEVHFEGDGVTYRVRIEVENGAFEVDVDVDD